MTVDVDVAWVDELLHRATVCRDEARLNGEKVIEEISEAKINALLELRLELPEPREPVE
jgi:hypothetical protein